MLVLDVFLSVPGGIGRVVNVSASRTPSRGRVSSRIILSAGSGGRVSSMQPNMVERFFVKGFPPYPER